MDDGDIQVGYAGHRMAWRAVSPAGRRWADRRRRSFPMAPEGAECLIEYGDPLIVLALTDGLVVMAGDVEVSLCR